MKTPSKKIIGIALIVVSILGSFINFYATNFVLGDVSNLTYGLGNRPYYIFATMPMLNLAFIFVLAAIFLIRVLRRPEHLKRMSRLYCIIFMAFSFLGLLGSVMSGIFVYKTFTAPNPFPGYLIIGIIVYALFLSAGAFFFIKVYPSMIEDQTKRQIKAGYVFYSIVLSCLTYYAFNRFGALMWLPSYLDAPTFDMTWPFYLSLALPLLMFAHNALYSFDFYKRNSGKALIAISVILGLFVIGTFYTWWVGTEDTQFISVISPSMGASRLLALPIDFIAHALLFGAFGVYSLIHSINYYKKHKA